MKFLYPLGLIGLVGVPILIIIYLIKNKYTEQTVPSTWLWELSEKFLKRKKKVNPIAGLISLILQIIAVTAISFAIAQPIVVLPNQAKEMCFIVDASASMNMDNGEKTRLDLAKDYISQTVESSVNGSVYSVVYVAENTEIICEKSRDKDDVLELVSAIKPGYVSVDLSSAISLVQTYFTSNPGVKVYLITDTEYETTENIEVVNIANHEVNACISSLDVAVAGAHIQVKGNVAVHGAQEDTVLTLGLFVDGAEVPVQTQEVIVAKDASLDFVFDQDDVIDFSNVSVKIVDNDDALAADDESIYFNVQHENAYNTIVVSDTPYMISTAISAVSGSSVKVVSTAEYNGETGYGLYVFDNYAPETLPTDGAVWFMGLQGSVSGAGFSFQGEEELPDGETLSMSTASSSLAQRLTEGVEGKNIYIKKYLRYGKSSQFTTLLTYKSNPAVFVGTTSQGCREVVFAFDIHNTDLPMSIDFLVLVRNLLGYCYPTALEEVSYYSGDTLEVNLQPNMQSVRVDAPSGSYVYLATNGAIAEYALDEVGTHKVTITYQGTGTGASAQRVYYVYSGVPVAERVAQATETYVGLQGEATDGGLDGTYDPLIWVFALLALVFLADWGVYCYEKYQLR